MNVILVTGGAGFIGSHYLNDSVKNHPNQFYINLDNLSYASNLSLLDDIQNKQNYLFIEGSICNKQLLTKLFTNYCIQGVVHFAAESHVDNSIFAPEQFIETNIKGTFQLLEAAKQSWMEAPFCCRELYKGARFHHVSTDEIYGTLGPLGQFSETSPYAPNSPYSASKASSNLLVRSYHKTFGLNCTISNCSNNFGPGQHHEKLIPTIIRKALNNEAIPIYGDGTNIRDWLYVKDHCEAIETIFLSSASGEVYNIGGYHECNNLELAQQICQILDQLIPRGDGLPYHKQITFVEDRPGHDWRYSIDASKLTNQLNWHAKTDFSLALKESILWYCNLYKITKSPICT